MVIVGNSGSGKTTLADHVAQRLGVPHVELDAHYHQAGWTPTPPEEFADAVRAALDAADAASGGWVVCGNYPPVRSQIWARADTIVWLDLPRPLVMWRVTSRSFGQGRAAHGAVERQPGVPGEPAGAARPGAERDPLGVGRRGALPAPLRAGDGQHHVGGPALVPAALAGSGGPVARGGQPAAGQIDAGRGPPHDDGSRRSVAPRRQAPAPDPLPHPFGSTPLPRMPTNSPGEGGALWRAGSSGTRWSAGV